MTAEEQLDVILASMPQDETTLALLKHIFLKTAEIDASLGALAPVIGAMAGRLGLSREQIKYLIEKYPGA